MADGGSDSTYEGFKHAGRSLAPSSTPGSDSTYEGLKLARGTVSEG